MNILLTDYGNLFTRDFFLPTGDLRDARSSYKRAEIIVVTKCPPLLSEDERRSIIQEIDPQEGQQVFFTMIAYGTPYHITTRNYASIDTETEVLLVTGIANPKPLKHFLEEKIHVYHMMHYNDHHIFSIDDWRDIKGRYESMEAKKKMVLTTEKDAMRLLKFSAEIDGMAFYVIPIEHKFLFNEEQVFLKSVEGFIENFKNPT
jgi:tetraacyldisaccharide 4'-kinase